VKRAQSVLEPQRVGGMLAQLPQRKKAAALRGLALLADAAQKFMEKSPTTMVGLGRQR
jgi:hypothetical protein